MGHNSRICFLLTVVSVGVYGCGFKSDLFLPGEPGTVGQLDSSSMEIMKQKTLDGIDNQDLEAVKSQIRDITDDQTSTDGVPVTIEPPKNDLIEEINKNRDKNKLP